MTTLMLLLLLFVAAVLLLAIRTAVVLPWRRRQRCRQRDEAATVSTMIIMGSGGHTAEMLRMLRNFRLSRYTPRVYVVAATDSHSKRKVIAFEEAAGSNPDAYRVVAVPRSREVGQSYGSSVFTTLYACFFSVKLLCQTLPDLVLCNGPGTCVPLVAASYVPRVLGVRHVSTVYVESICRVEDISLSAKLLYCMVDRLLVQWPELTAKYPKAEYLGLLSQ